VALKMPFFWWLPVGEVPEVSVQDLRSWLDEGHPLQMVDARTRLEYESGSIGEARHAPLTEMPASLQRLEIDPGKPVVMLCLSGHRSRPGTRWLRARGIKAYSLQGGITAWKKAGLPLNKPNHHAG
jgi:rhodanese-related sulfurtransferase